MVTIKWSPTTPLSINELLNVSYSFDTTSPSCGLSGEGCGQNYKYCLIFSEGNEMFSRRKDLRWIKSQANADANNVLSEAFDSNMMYCLNPPPKKMLASRVTQTHYCLDIKWVLVESITPYVAKPWLNECRVHPPPRASSLIWLADSEHLRLRMSSSETTLSHLATRVKGH